jgi:hypothetical protein
VMGILHRYTDTVINSFDVSLPVMGILNR